MVSVIVVPSTLASSEYLETPRVDEIHPLQLLIIEEKLDEMIGRILKVMKEVGKHMPPAKEPQLQLETLAMQCMLRPAVLPIRSFDEHLTEVGSRVSSLQESITTEGPQPQATQESTADQYIFIRSLHFLVPWRLRRRFQRLFDPRVVMLVKRVNDDAIYTVYCLKSEVKSALECVHGQFRRDVQEISEHVILQMECTGSRDEAERERLWQVMVQCIELLVSVSILRGFAEAVNKYGLPPDFKYKITASVDREIKRLKRLRRGSTADVYDSIAIVDMLL